MKVRLFVTKRRVAIAEDCIAELGAVVDVDPLVALALIKARDALALDPPAADAAIREAVGDALEVERRRIQARREGRRLPAPGTRVNEVVELQDGLPTAVTVRVEEKPGRNIRRVTAWTEDGMPKTVEEFDA